MIEDFCVFILTHGRPNNVVTYDTLKRARYTGPLYIVIDDEDKSGDEYRERFGDKVVMFKKAEIAKTFDEGDNFGDRRTIVYARNACFGIARELGYTYFMELDDDYHFIGYVGIIGGQLRRRTINSMDAALRVFVEYYKSIPVDSIALAQGGDFFGGINASFISSTSSKRKAMNSFICSVDRQFAFVGRINEDVNTYTSLQSRGSVMMTMAQAQVNQPETQTSEGGMSTVYLNQGTYVKSFYSVMYSPSSVKVRQMGRFNMRLHHNITWRNTTPCIIAESWRKPDV